MEERMKRIEEYTKTNERINFPNLQKKIQIQGAKSIMKMWGAYLAGNEISTVTKFSITSQDI